jgi:uncharacterized protein YjbI with pentapeptide repeats
MNKYTVIKSWAFICFLSLFVLQTPVFAAGDSGLIKENIAILKKTKACPGCDLKGAVLNRMDLSEANLQGADLTDAKLFLTNLSGANLKNAHLERAIFGGADLGGADLRGADLNGADLTSAYLVGSKFDGEFIKTKPYADEGLPEVEKETYVDDTVRPKKIEKDHAASQPSENGSQSLGAERMKVLSPDTTLKTPEKQEKAAEKIAEEGMNQKADTGNENKTLEQQGETAAPPVKTVQPIKKAIVKEKMTSSQENENTEKTAGNGKNAVIEDGKTQNDESNTQEKEDTDIAENTKTENVSAEQKPTVPESTTLGENKQNTPSVSSSNKENPNVSMKERSGKDQGAVQKISDRNQPIIEKDLPLAKKTVKEQGGKTAISQNKETANDKAKDLKRLLDTNKCYHCDLSGLDLSGKNLDKADLEGADFTGSNLEKTDLRGAILKGAAFVNANLKMANLKEADLYKADFSGADLTGADLNGAKTDGTKFDDAIGIHK